MEIVGVEREEGERAGVHERRGERVPELARDGHHDDERDAHVPVNERRVGRRIQTRARRTRSRGHHRHHDAWRERVLDDARARDAVVAAGDERNEWWGRRSESRSVTVHHHENVSTRRAGRPIVSRLVRVSNPSDAHVWDVSSRWASISTAVLMISKDSSAPRWMRVETRREELSIDVNGIQNVRVPRRRVLVYGCMHAIPDPASLRGLDARAVPLRLTAPVLVPVARRRGVLCTNPSARRRRP